MIFPFKRVELAWKMSTRYKLKALSLFIFLSLSFTVMLAGFDVLVSTFNGWFSRQMTFLQPNYYITASKTFDMELSDYGFKDQVLSETTRQAVQAKLGDLKLYDGISLVGSLYVKDQPAKSQFVMIVGLDFAKAREIFPAIAQAYTQDQMLRFKAERRILVDRTLAVKADFAEDQEFVLLLENYFKNVNGLKMKSTIFRSPLSDFKKNFIEMPVVWADLDALKLVAGLPAGKGWPFFGLSTEKVVSPQAIVHEARLNRELSPLNVSFYTPVTAMSGMKSSFRMFVSIFTLLGILISIVVTASTSSNLFINFQNRKADFGLMKAFGFASKDFFGLVFLENLFSLLTAFALALVLNVLLALTFPRFELLGVSANLKLSFFSVGSLLILILVINVVSILKPFFYLRKVDPVIIMREE